LLAPSHLLTRSVRWQYLLKYEKKKTRFYNRFAANTVGFTVSFIFPGRLGELVRPVYLAQKEGIKKGFAVGTIVVERIFDILTNCLILGFFLISRPLFPSYYHADEAAFSKLYFWGIFGVAVSVFLLLLILALYLYKEKTVSVFRFLLKPFPKKITGKILGLLDEFILGLKFFHSAGNLIVYVLLSVGVWLAIMFFYWIFFLAFNADVPFLAVIPFVFLTGVGASIPTPGMVGGYHYFSKLGMTGFLNMEANFALGATIVMHAAQLVMTCLLGYAILWKEGLSLLQIKKLGEDKGQ
ncbi:MAG: flippase-like domain-containing protein, partial [Candidatus Aminicenantes bacterium]|nr:flippase-like domain-containing protein [Candidatus Aminicenantes bacterium]